MSISMSYASEKKILEDYINSFAWDKRIVLFISKSKYVYFINETDNFFKKNKCENDNRNLKYIRIVGDEVKNYNISEKFKNKYGMWLIGYDGQIKSYSSDISLLKKIYNIIDKMPLRKKEKLEQKIKCNNKFRLIVE